MMETMTKIKAAVAGVCGAVTAVFGWLGWLVIGWAACMLLDYVTGSIAAARAEKWSSAAARDGLYHKLGMIVAVLVSAAADGLLGIIINNLPGIALPFDYSALICPLVLCWYIITELGSITENAAALGAPLPPFLQKILACVQSGTEAAGEKLAGEKTEREE